MDVSGRLLKMESREKSSELTIAGLPFVNGELANQLALDMCDATGTEVTSTGILDAFLS